MSSVGKTSIGSDAKRTSMADRTEPRPLPLVPAPQTPFVRTLRNEPSRRAIGWTGYAVAVAATAAALAVRMLLASRLADDAPMLLFPFAVALSAYIGGIGPGLVATALGAVLAVAFVMPPLGLGIEHSMDGVRLIVFVMLGAVVSLLSEALHRSRRLARISARALRQSDERLAEMIRQAPSFIAILRGPEHVFEMANDKYVEVCGRRDLLGKTIRQVFPEVAGQGHFEILDRVYQTGEPFTDREMRMMLARRTDAALEEVYVDFVCMPLRAADGAISGILIHGVDITQQVLARKSVEQWAEQTRMQSQQLRLITDAVPVLISYVDAEYHYRLVNHTYEQWFLRKREQIEGRHVRQVLGEAAWEQVRPYMERALAGEVVEYEQELPYQKGGARWVHVIYTPDRDENNGVRGFVVLVHDVAEAKRTEQALRQSEERARRQLGEIEAIYNSAHTGMCVFDRELRFVRINERLAGINGIPVAEHIGRTVREIVPDLADVAEKLAKQIFETGQPALNIEISGITPALPGIQRSWIEQWLPLRDVEGNVVGINVVAEEVTEQKRAQDELCQAKAAAEQASAAKDHFLAVLSHELRTPLTPVLTAAQLLEREQATSPEIRELMGMIRRNVELEVKLIDDLLDLTRISRGKLQLHIASIDLHEKLRAVLAICENDIRGKQLALAVQLNATRHTLQADSARLQQVLWNLLRNAIKFTPIGGSIWITTENVADERITVVIRDSGVGIEPELLARIFDPFEQGGRDVSRLFGGLGLGLSITKGLVELHGGTIIAHSEGRNRGAAFMVQLPLSPLTEASPSDDHGRTPVAPVRCRILLVEDHSDTARVMSRLLTSIGCEVQIASSVASALKLAAAEPFDLVISDIGLPDGSGYDLMRQVLAKRSIRGIALSGYGMEDDVRRSLEAGFAAHLTKPVNIQKLEELIRQMQLN